VPQLSRFVDRLARSTVHSLPQPAAAFLRRRKRNIVARRFDRSVVSHTYAGVRLNVLITDRTAADWYDQEGHASMPEIELLSAGKLQPGARVFDIGAHQCVIALTLLDWVSPHGSVVAVEAGHHDVEVARRNAELNGNPDGLSIVHAAGADHEGTMIFDELSGHVPDDARSANDPVEVRGVTLDSLAEEFGTPDVLYIDVEGAEGAVLRGGAKVLASGPDAFVEVHVGVGLERLGSSASAIVDFFDPSKYRMFVGAQGVPDFAERHAGDALPDSRFFLVCLARETSIQNTPEDGASVRRSAGPDVRRNQPRTTPANP
jgi:FkbM family methyltransferase